MVPLILAGTKGYDATAACPLFRLSKLHLRVESAIDYKKVQTKEQFLELIQELSEQSPDDWENVYTQAFLEALEAWLGSADNFYKNLNLDTDANKPSWQLFADALQAALIYE